MISFVGQGKLKSKIINMMTSVTLTSLVLLCMVGSSFSSPDPCAPNGGYEIYTNVKEDKPVLSVIYTLRIPGSENEVDLVPENSTYFKFDPASRNITLKKRLDRDTPNPGDTVKYYVRCKAKKESTYININFVVVVQDVNDNAPTFTQDEYVVTVKETLAVGDNIVTGIRAYDNDSSNNGIIYYRVLNGTHSHYFDIVDPVKANLKLIEKLDYETENLLTVQILAEDQPDQGTSLNDTTTLTIHVKDEDDMPPKFTRERYSGTTIENSPPGTTVQMNEPIAAYDQDISFNNSVIYSIIDVQRVFAIDRDTAIVTVTRKPPPGVVNLFIQATQVNNKQQSGVSILNIRVTESNMNAPYFLQKFYSVTVPENTPVGTTVLKVTASDKDYGANIFYGIDVQKTFKMDRESGFIVVSRPLDYERQKQYDLQISASDGMSTAYATVQILIADVNDNNPVIKNEDVTSTVQRQLGAVVTHIEAQDLDNNTELTYALLAHNNIFGIDSSGYITVVDADNIKEDVYILAVTVTDNGNPPRQAVATVTVKFPPLPHPSPVVMAGAGSDILAIAFGVLAAVLLITVTILIIYIIKRRLQANAPLDKAKISHALDPKGLLYQKQSGSRSASRVNLNFRGNHEETADSDTTVAKNPFTIGETDFRMYDSSSYAYIPSDESETDRDMDEIQIETAVIPYRPGTNSLYQQNNNGFHPSDEDDSFQEKMNHSNGSFNTSKNSGSLESLHSEGASSKTMLMNTMMESKKSMPGKMMPWDSSGHLASMKPVHSIDGNPGIGPIDEKPEITVYF